MKASRKYLDHTADILLQAEAPTLSELFEQCALAVEESQVNLNSVECVETKKITGENKKIDLLLFDFLDDLLFYKDSELLIFKKFDIKIKLNEGKYLLDCLAYGDKIDYSKHETDAEIKAITLHLFEVKKVESGWWAQVLLDI
ncbi:archease [archaeon]|jgi:SHS2 domain-containing protein|nr:archease [archaeon]MBT3451636.1 archease [archaeon]MBT6869657.1 archease [archaeon]MBT7192425.1 archease [archaeon]MBT7380226.1 archease [archaeon]